MNSIAAIMSPAGGASSSFGLGGTRPISSDPGAEAGPHHCRSPAALAGAAAARGRGGGTFVQLATGLNRWDRRSGAWVPAAARFEPIGRGHFIARQTQHRVVLGPDLSAPGAVKVRTPDGLRLRSRPVGIVVRDRASSAGWLLARVRCRRPELAAPDEVIYPRALEGLRGDVRYRLGLNWFEQELILREALPAELLLELGLDPARTEVLVLTEFLDPPAPRCRPRACRRRDGEALSDVRLEFGAMTLDPSRALALGGGVPGGGASGQDLDLEGAAVPVGKAWWEGGARGWLMEAVPYADLAALMDGWPVPTPWRRAVLRSKARRVEGLPGPGGGPGGEVVVGVPLGGGPRCSADPSGQGINDRAWAKRPIPAALLPSLPLAHRSAATSGWARAPGLVLDYVLVTNQSDFVFRADTTYYVTGTVDLGGTTTLEGGAVVKFPPGDTRARIRVRGPLVCATGPYRPALFTARDDNTAGLTLPHSTGVPCGEYGGFALYAYDTDAPVEVRHVRVTHVTVGVAFFGNPANRLRHAQLVSTRYPVYASSAGPVLLDNLLVAQVASGGRVIQNVGSLATVQATHLTVDTAPEMSTWTLNLRNSLLVSLAVPGGYTGDHNRVLPHGSGVFVGAGAGAHYLAPDSPHRHAGADDLPADLLAELRDRTTQPPLAWSEPLAAATVWEPCVERSTDLPDLGYHYPALDYLCADLQVADEVLRLRRGVAVGVYGSTGLCLTGTGRLLSEGRPERPNRIVRAVTLQEQVPTAWETGVNDALLADEPAASAASVIRLRFTELVVPGGGGHHFRGGARLGALLLQDCEVTGGHLSWWGEGAYERRLLLVNNVFDRVSLGLGHGTDRTFTVLAHNNLFRACPRVNLNAATPNAWRWHDNLFDATTLWQYYGAVANSHNAFWKCPHHLAHPGPGTLTLTALTYAADGWGRRWYARAVPTLVNAGSRPARDAGLFRHTTQLEQTPKGDNPVDIGFHHLPLADGLPFDADGDALPDYLEDANGDGTLDDRETDPDVADTDADGCPDAEELAAGTDPTDPSSFTPRRLGSWQFDGSAWLVGDQGQEPLAHPGAAAAPSFAGTALQLTGPGSFVKYRDRESGGQLNLAPRQGGVRLWFRPDWSSRSGPGHWACLLAVGRHGDTRGGWFMLRLAPDGNVLEFSAHAGTGPTSPPLILSHPLSLHRGTWYQITLGYGQHPSGAHHVARLYVNGDGTASPPLPAIPSPPAVTWGEGFSLGSDLEGQHPAGGLLDGVETFNYLLGRAHAEGVGRILTARGVEGAEGGSAIELEWRTDPNRPVLLERRAAGDAAWIPLATSQPGWRYRDDSPVPGGLYDYRVTTGGGPPPARLDLRVACPPHARAGPGTIILLIEETLLSDLAPEVERLQADLAAEGWTVILQGTPRHDDEQWANNPGPIRRLKTFLEGVHASDPLQTRGVFLLGHVPIPYSGLAVVPDGHADHRGAWPADGYYGSLAAEGWTDAGTWAPANTAVRPRQVNLPGDGKFDQNAFPLDPEGRRLAMFVGRVDFANLPAFQRGLPPGVPARTELDLLRGYLDKNHAYRTGRLRFARRGLVTNWMWEDRPNEPAQRMAWRNATLLGPASEVEWVETDFLRRPPSSLLSFHQGWGLFDALNVLPQLPYPRHTTQELARGQGDARSALLFVDASYLGDFDSEDNLLRALLTCPAGGLAAAYAGFVDWDLRALARGEPLGEALLETLGNDELIDPDAHTYVTLLGDPTLRLAEAATAAGA